VQQSVPIISMVIHGGGKRNGRMSYIKIMLFEYYIQTNGNSAINSMLDSWLPNVHKNEFTRAIYGSY